MMGARSTVVTLMLIGPTVSSEEAASVVLTAEVSLSAAEMATPVVGASMVKTRRTEAASSSMLTELTMTPAASATRERSARLIVASS